jgi:hypothetical protein
MQGLVEPEDSYCYVPIGYRERLNVNHTLVSNAEQKSDVSSRPVLK